MPSFITHALIGNEIRKALTLPKAVAAVNRCPVAFEWGCQGPDLLFFGERRKNHPNPLGEHGPRLHKEDTDRLFREIVRYLISLKETDYFEPSLSYALGFICHYTLDKNIHPYVYFMQEKMRDRYYSSVHYGIHMKLETDLDTAFYQVKTGEANIRRYRINPELETDCEAQMIACNFLSAMIQANHGVKFLPGQIRPCLINLYHKEKFMLEPTGIVSAVRCRLEDFSQGNKNVQYANQRPRRVDYDILNQNHEQWLNFRQKDIPRHDSVLDILATAKEEACQLAELLLECIENNREFPLTDMPTFDDGNPDVWGM